MAIVIEHFILDFCLSSLICTDNYSIVNYKSPPMKFIYLCLISVLFSFNSAFSQVWEWTKTELNGIAQPNESDAPYELAADAQGNVYTLGDYNDSLYLNGTFITKGYGSYLAKYSAAGTLQWYRLIRRTDARSSDYTYKVQASDMVLNSQGIFLTGYIPADPFGTPTTYQIGTNNYTVDTTDRHIYGSTNEFFVCRINLNGGVVWNKTSRNVGIFTESYKPVIATDNNNAIIVSASKGNLVCCGNYQNSFLVGTDVITDNSGRPYREQLFILKFSVAGNFIWSAYVKDNLTNSGSGIAISLSCDNSNNVWLYTSAYSGVFFNNTQFNSINGGTSQVNVVAKLNRNGSVLFAKEISTGAHIDREARFGKPQFMAFDNTGNLYALVNLQKLTSVSYLNSNIPITTTQSTSAYILKYDNAGNFLWFKSFGSRYDYGDNYSTDIKFYNNALWITGSIRSSFSNPDTAYFKFDPLTVPDKRASSNFLKYFAAKADTAGNFKWATTFSGGSNVHGFSVLPTNNGVYTAGAYRVSINDLGKLGGSFVNPDIFIHNQFFGKLRDQSINIGAVTPKQLIPGCTINIPFVSDGLTFSATNTFTAQLSNENGDFSNATAIGNVSSTGSGSITATIPASLTYNSGYRIRIRSSDTLLTGYNYYAYADTGYKLTLTCLAPSAGFTSTNITSTAATVSWLQVGCAAGYRLQYRIKGTSAWTTAATLTSNSITSFNLTGLAPNTVYQWRIATRCRNNNVITYSAYTNANEFRTATAFSLAENNNNISTVQKITTNIQPNPANDIAILSLKGNVQNATVTMVDFTGKIISKENSVSAGQLQLPVSKLAAGTYLIKITSNTENRTLKLIKK